MVKTTDRIVQTEFDFDGETFERQKDGKRLNKQFNDVFEFMRDEKWHSLNAIHTITEYPESSISARIRDFRKVKFGAHTVNRRRIKDSGTWQYQLIINQRSM